MTPDVLREHLLEDLLEARALGVGQLAGDAAHRRRRARRPGSGRAALTWLGEAGALVPDRVLGDLHEHPVAGLERELDAARLVLAALSEPRRPS